MIDDGRQAVIDVAYFAAAILFIVGLKFLATPDRARRGNQLAALGMGVAILATFLSRGWESSNYILIVVGIALGGGAAAYFARVVKMTAMPQMTAIYNGMGGATVAFVSLAEFMHKKDIGAGEAITIVVGLIIGAISFTGSIVAFAKLQEIISGGRITFPNQQQFNLVAAGALAVLTVLIVALGDGSLAESLLWVTFAVALAVGFSVVLPIGGADMPVVIAVLNSLTGLAAALSGLALNNQAMVIAGALVGASGTYLTLLMAKAMNRSIANIVFGSWGAAAAGGAAGAGGSAETRPVRETSADDLAWDLVSAERIVIVPGYGLAVAQAQHAVREMADLLRDGGREVKYAIHPVAGRMPGHMNVLLAEANVSYDDLYEMEDINDEFPSTDVALVIGANDVTNPAAREPGSPIYGMPILNVDQAKKVVVFKRSRKPGYAGIDNDLFYAEKTQMLFGDAKATLDELLKAVKTESDRYEAEAA